MSQAPDPLPADPLDPTVLAGLLRQMRIQWLVWLGVMLVIAGFITATQLRERANGDEAEREHLQTQVRVAERILNGQVASVDAALRTMLGGIERWRGADGRFLPFAHEHLQRVEAMMPGADSFMVLDAAGICQLSSAPQLIGLDFSSSDFFNEVRKSTVPGLLNISAPQRFGPSNWSVSVSRAIPGQDGAFNGLVAAALAPQYFQGLMTNLRYSDDMRVSLVHGGGGIYVSSPSSSETTLPGFRDGGNFFSRHLASGLPETFISAVKADGVAQIGMARTITPPGVDTSHSFVAVASRDVPVIRAQWMRDNLRHGGIVLGLCLLSGSFLWVYQRREARMLTQKAQYTRELQRSNQRFEQIASTIPCVLFDFEVVPGDLPSILYVGPYSQTLLGLTPAEVMGPGRPFLQALHPDDAAPFKKAWSEALQQSTPLDCEFRFLHRGSEQRWLRMSATPAAASETAGAAHWSGYLIDISDSKFHQLAMQTLAYQDPLTNANNRRSFMEKLHLEFDRVHRTKAEAALVMLDVDFFKRINDEFGHDVGDDALKHLVQLLMQQLRSIDTLGRLGGEEFAILLPETPLEAATLLAERLRHAVEISPLQTPTGPLHFTVSMGLAVLGVQAQDVNTVIKAADEAMYHAKHTGRNRVCCAGSQAAGPEVTQP